MNVLRDVDHKMGRKHPAWALRFDRGSSCHRRDRGYMSTRDTIPLTALHHMYMYNTSRTQLSVFSTSTAVRSTPRAIDIDINVVRTDVSPVRANRCQCRTRRLTWLIVSRGGGGLPDANAALRSLMQPMMPEGPRLYMYSRARSGAESIDYLIPRFSAVLCASAGRRRRAGLGSYIHVRYGVTAASLIL